MMEKEKEEKEEKEAPKKINIVLQVHSCPIAIEDTLKKVR